MWDTLAAWASRAQDPVAWYESLIALARKGPEALAPMKEDRFHVVFSTLEGARQFATSTEPSPAEWLCVFDPAIRYATPGHLGQWDKEGAYFDSFDAYGIDADPPPPQIRAGVHFPRREVPTNVWDCLVSTDSDRREFFQDHGLLAFEATWPST